MQKAPEKLTEERREPLSGEFGARREIPGPLKRGPSLLRGKTLRPKDSLSVVGLQL